MRYLFLVLTLTLAHDCLAGFPVPHITAVSPNSGPPGGGTSVTLIGSGFVNTGGENGGVKFGATQVPDYLINSDTQITVFSPPGSGTVDITVSGLGGTSPISAADQFTYLATPVVLQSFDVR
jgi:hypothetical protein